jgi:hypothetical protein
MRRYARANSWYPTAALYAFGGNSAGGRWSRVVPAINSAFYAFFLYIASLLQNILQRRRVYPLSAPGCAWKA